MRPYVLVRYNDVVRERHPRADEDVHFAESVVEAVLEDLTAPGDRVLDPFAGFGTTLRVAEQMGRHAVGVEMLPARCDIIRSSTQQPVVQGDARELATLLEGPFDLVLSSPPYMTEYDHPEDPLAAYGSDGPGYATYLTQLTDVMEQAVSLLRPQGYLVLNVANIASPGHFTPLAWDVARSVAGVARLVQDVMVCWDHPLGDLAGDYLLVFRAP
ncbi:class I SAM-dependent methyltransferase [Luteipulveratus flavus]|uniref:Methyltransferase n=1 Tax=Luteipulveratus flavus TaxID=3031728 RepID=A0ABT6CBP6_9MICO|nr:class I SAM-dependent methyltransferase [Luteipulveratus sp. YIM 133296]MDF8266181.1 class I SAM-dependent methyltransferase [Luteipulveratus sp. YIM 133296]